MSSERMIRATAAQYAFWMALDGKTIIKEEITEKDPYDSSASSNSGRRVKINSNSASITEKTNSSTNTPNNNTTNSSTNTSSSNSRGCRTPDSPESARAVAPRSPMSPQIHHTSLAPPPRPNRNASASPVVNGATTTPPPPIPTAAPQTTAPSAVVQAAVAQAAVAAAHAEQARVLAKIRKFLGSLVQMTQEAHPEVSDRVRSLVLSLGSGGINIDEFRIGLQDIINLPLRPYVMPLLKNNISLLQREVNALARATNQSSIPPLQTAHQYVTNNENVVMEFTQGPAPEYNDIFIHEATAQNLSNGGSSNPSLVFKRRSSETLLDHHNGVQDWGADYLAGYPPAKRLHAHNPQLSSADSRHSYTGPQTIFDYSSAAAGQTDVRDFNNLMDKNLHRDERDLRNPAAANTEAQRHLTRTNLANVPSGSVSGGAIGVGGSATAVNSGIGGEEEWKNIHTMLNCISAMVEKTKRAITILQQRGVEPQPPNYTEMTPATLLELRRQTEEKVAEFKRNAEEAVNQVKRQAVIEIQRAVVTAETRAAEVMAQERLRMEKFFVEMSRHSGAERELDNKSPSIAAGQNACWNCGRKATETCSGCNLARYCGAFCQHKDWEHHHQICGTTRTNDLTAKHSQSQHTPIAVSLRGTMARSPPTQNASQSGAGSQQSVTSNSVGVTASVPNAQTSSLTIPNGIGSK